MPVIASYPSLSNSADWPREACGRNSLILSASKIRDRATTDVGTVCRLHRYGTETVKVNIELVSYSR
jgi:hypothetical protein